MQNRLDRKTEIILEEKQERRRAVAREVDRRKAVELAMDEMEEYVAELQDQIFNKIKRTSYAWQDAKTAKAGKQKAESASFKRYALLKDLRIQVHELKDQLPDESK